MNETVRRDIDAIVEVVSEVATPRRIIVFGSQVYGQPSEDSDIDVCVVTDSMARRTEVLKSIRERLFGKVASPIDFVVYGSEDFSRRALVSNSFERMIEQKGIAVYG